MGLPLNYATSARSAGLTMHRALGRAGRRVCTLPGLPSAAAIGPAEVHAPALAPPAGDALHAFELLLALNKLNFTWAGEGAGKKHW